MCGLTGVIAFTEQGRLAISQLQAAAAALSHRGPDAEGFYRHNNIGLAHRRLSIISPQTEANQPFIDSSRRYVLVFNGEIFNYKALRIKLQHTGVTFRTDSDSEVLLELYKQKGQNCLKKLHGFFAFAIYDTFDGSLFLARDRFGEKPLVYYKDADKFIFGSELAALFALDVPREIDYTSLFQYLQLTYVPAPATMLKGVKKLLPGHSLYIKNNKVQQTVWYRLPYDAAKAESNPMPYKQQQLKLKQLLEQAVTDRMVADVPVGALLSGGLDSSIVVALAARQNPSLKTFSVGFPDQPYFDETAFARLVATKYKTDHTEVLFTNHELGQHLYSMLNSQSEPFADSSALAVYALSRQVGASMKSVLSGDGADELFAGYNKHRAEYKVLTGGLDVKAVKSLKSLWSMLPKSRNDRFSNTVRQLQRFAAGANLLPEERYWFWAGWQTEQEALALFRSDRRATVFNKLYVARKNRLLMSFRSNLISFNNVLCADWELVLANDMLHKTDTMGMANGLEIRSPYLDHRLVKFAFSLPAASKIDGAHQKKLLKDTFRTMLPPELYSREKKGFEIPLLSFLKKEGAALIQEFLSDTFIADQGIFDQKEVKQLRKTFESGAAANVQTKVWSLLVFQFWWKNNIKLT